MYIILAHVPTRISGQTKLTFFALTLSCFLTFTMLCSRAVNFLTSGYVIYPFKSLEDLIVNTNYSVAILDVSLASQTMKVHSLFYKILKFFIFNLNFISTWVECILSVSMTTRDSSMFGIMRKCMKKSAIHLKILQLLTKLTIIRLLLAAYVK